MTVMAAAQGNAESAGRVQTCDLLADSTDQLGPEQQQADDDAQRANHQNPARHRDLGVQCAALHGRHNGRQWADGVGNIVGAVGEGEQCSGEDQRPAEQLANGLPAVFQSDRGPRDQRPGARPRAHAGNQCHPQDTPTGGTHTFLSPFMIR